MESNHNEIAEGFLARHGLGEKNSTVFLSLQKGYLKLEYGRFDREDALSIVSFVRHNSEDARAVGCLLKLRLFPGGSGDKGTFIAENAVSGLQWARGKVFGGNTYDLDSEPVLVSSNSDSTSITACPAYSVFLVRLKLIV